MKFLNKKEQVFDIQLTPYGKHKLSAGDFTPMYYAFFDDNILYDAQYANSVAENPTRKATATIVISDSGGIINGETFTLVDSNGLSTVYTINGGVLPADGGGSGGSATVGFSGVGGGAAGLVAAAAAMVIAINGTTDANYTAVSSGVVVDSVIAVTITQNTAGVVGNRVNKDSISSTVVSNFVGGGFVESQNDIHKRIKQETQYLESQTLFRQVLSGAVTQGGILQETIYEQEQNLLTSDGFIGDAKLLSKETDVAPAWKFITMQNNITSSAFEDTKNNSKVPQINITASYILQSRDPADLNLREENVRQINSRTATFSDGRLIELEMNDPLIYLEELNTELLTDNFDIEVFQVTRGTSDDDFRQLFFRTKAPQVVNGMLISPQPILNDSLLTTGSVEYYFSIAKDSEVDPKLACKYINQFNSENYLIDLDFDCSDANGEDVYFDIYGRVTESEICPD